MQTAFNRPYSYTIIYGLKAMLFAAGSRMGTRAEFYFSCDMITL